MRVQAGELATDGWSHLIQCIEELQLKEQVNCRVNARRTATMSNVTLGVSLGNATTHNISFNASFAASSDRGALARMRETR